MAEQQSQQSMFNAKTIIYAIGSLIVFALYFTWLDWALMSMQGLDYFYMFRK